jgi:GntR family transcriptional regulator/MocR family aminotransferase
VSRNTVSFAIEQLAAEGYLTLSAGAGRRWPKAFRSTAAGFIAKQPRRSARISLSAWARACTGRTGRPFMTDGRGRSSPGSAMNASFRTRYGAVACGARREMRRCAATGPSTIQPLQEALLGHLVVHRGIKAKASQILIVPTAQAGLTLVANALLERGDHAWIESPGYGGANVALHAAGAVVSAMPLDAQGMAISSPRRRLA